MIKTPVNLQNIWLSVPISVMGKKLTRYHFIIMWKKKLEKNKNLCNIILV